MARRITLPHITKGYNMKKTTKAQKQINTVHMPKATLQKYGQAATQIETTLGLKRGEQYQQIARGITAHLGSGRDNTAKHEWDYRRNAYAVACGFKADTDGKAKFNASAQYKGLRDALKAIGFKVPENEVDESTKAERERAKAAKQRAINRLKAEVKKSQPKISKEMLQAKADELYADKKAEATESGKQAKERAKVIVWLEALAKRTKAQDLGDADPKPCMERIAALIISVNELA